MQLWHKKLNKAATPCHQRWQRSPNIAPLLSYLVCSFQLQSVLGSTHGIVITSPKACSVKQKWQQPKPAPQPTFTSCRSRLNSDDTGREIQEFHVLFAIPTTLPLWRGTYCPRPYWSHSPYLSNRHLNAGIFFFPSRCTNQGSSQHILSINQSVQNPLQVNCQADTQATWQLDNKG